MGSSAEVAGASRDADLGLSSPYYEPLVGSQAQPNAFQSFEQDYYSAGGQLLNPSYNGSPIFPVSESSPFYNAPWNINPQNVLQQTQFGQSTNRIIDAFGGEQDYGFLSKAPTYNPRLVGSQASPGALALGGPFQAAQSVSSTPLNSPMGGAGNASPGTAGPSLHGEQGGGGQEAGKASKTGIFEGMFGQNADTLKKILGFAASAGLDKVIKTPRYPDASGAAQSIMAMGPTTAAGQEAERRMVEYLRNGPRITPISEEYISTVSKMFDDEMKKQLQMVDTQMQARGAGGFGGGSGDVQYLKGEIVNKYSLEKQYYIQKLLDERLREDVRNYYSTLNKVYGISEDEIMKLAQLEVEELAKQFELDYAEAEDLKKALGDMVYEFTWGESDKLNQIRTGLGERVLQAVVSGLPGGV